MDESGVFLKPFLIQTYFKKKIKQEVVKKSKQRFTIAFFVSAAGEKIEELIVTWKNKFPLFQEL